MAEIVNTHEIQIDDTLWQVFVNRHSVDMDKQVVTGLDIKKTAIRQGVNIELDFQLAVVDAKSSRHRIVGDADTIDVRAHDVFVATATDSVIWVIYVNRKQVNMDMQEVTGLEIKEAAIAQGVNIGLDFQLAARDPDGRHRIVGDSDNVDVRKDTTFFATAGDDNS